jgi:hypothetical protein
MDIKILSHEQIDFRARRPEGLREGPAEARGGLEFVASEVTIGTGRIDTSRSHEHQRACSSRQEAWRVRGEVFWSLMEYLELVRA